MDKLDNITQRAGSYQGLRKRAEQEKPRENASDLEIPSNHPIWDVWQAIRDAYPGPTANWDEIPPTPWVYALDGLSAEQIGTGLRTMVTEGGEFPPSAPSFRALCGPESWEHARQSRSVREVLSAPMIDKGEGRFLPPPTVTKSPQEYMADMRKVFGK